MRVVLPLGFLLALAAGCVIKANSSQDTLRQRGAHDLQCAPERLRVSNIGGTSYLVEGCGARHNYTCNHDGSTCVPEGNALPPEPPPPPSSSVPRTYGPR